MADISQVYENGVEDVRLGRYAKGIDLLAEVIESHDIDFGRQEHARMLLGYAKAKVADWNGAIECFKSAMVNDIHCMPAQTALGHAYIMAGRLTEAIEIFSLAVQTDPSSANARHGLGWALMLEGKNLKEALYQSHEALRLDPQSPAIRDSVGWALYKLGDIEAAAEQLEQAVRLDPDHPTILEHWREVKETMKRRQSEKSTESGIF